MQTPEKWMERHEKQMVEDICALVRIPSVSVTTGDPAAPFGEDCLKVLQATLSIGERMGFMTQNHENYCGSLVWSGETEREIGIFGHADVVPAGGGWDYEPFQPTVQDGMIIGRGASDNKGSMMAALYALYYLKEQGYQPKHSFRFFVGCSEEVGMDDIAYYTENYPEPVFSIVPDTAFPLCHGEKGILGIEAEYALESDVLLHFAAGVVANAVPSEASATLKISAEEAERLEALGALVTQASDGAYDVSVTGIAAHAAFPEGSDNAELKLARILAHSGVLDDEADALMKALCIVFGDYYGAGLGVPLQDEVSGKLTHVGGLASYTDGVFHQSINIRYNVTAEYETMISIITEVLQRYGFEVTMVDNSPPYHMDKNDPLVQMLLAIARRHLGEELEPYIMGGGTYARKLQRAVGFGPGIPKKTKRFGLDRGGAHQPDEYHEIEDLKKAFLIYVEAIQALDASVS